MFIRSRIPFRKPLTWISFIFIAGLLVYILIYYHRQSTKNETDTNSRQLLLISNFPQHENIFKELTSVNSKFTEVNVKPKKILIWNTYWNSRALWNKVFSELIHGQCSTTNCVLTMNKQELNSSDAVLFHLVDFRNHSQLPLYRNQSQIWIAMSYEPPTVLKHMGFDFSKLNGIFNRTMSYRRDSDIVVRHGKFYKIHQNDSQQKPNLPNFVSNWVNSIDDSKTRNYAEGKKRLVAWFASSRHCQSDSGREIYINQLQEHLEVDIYGSCGRYKCGSTKTIRNAYKVEHDDCYYLVSVGYKFVLAFENSICDDYVTEKLYNNLKLNVIPIVFGGGNYSYYAPPNSVIDATGMTPTELAKYLLQLDKNDTLYNEYFEWKKDYYIISRDGVPMACELCEKLNHPTWSRERKVYEHFDTWIESNCYDGYGTPLLSIG